MPKPISRKRRERSCHTCADGGNPGEGVQCDPKTWRQCVDDPAGGLPHWKPKPGAPKLDFVFTVCDDAANEVCPVWPGQPMTAHWGLPDPAAVEGSEAEQAIAFADCFRMLHQRIDIFVNLPFDRLSKLSLQKHLEDIGKTQDAGAKEPA